MPVVTYLRKKGIDIISPLCYNNIEELYLMVNTKGDDAIVIDLSDENIGHEKEQKKDWRDFPNRERNTMIIALTEGDVLVDGDTYRHVSDGEVYVYADGTIDESKGELAEVSIEGVQDAMTTGKTVFNLEDVG